MKSNLTAGLNPEQAREIGNDFEACPRFRERLAALLLTKVESQRKELRNPENYANASWPYQQADGIGYERGLLEVISLITSKKS